MDKGIEALINKPIHQERRFQFIGKKQIEYWAEIDAGAYKYLPESERRIVYSELEVKALIAELEQAKQCAKNRDEENQGLMLTIGRLRVERWQLESAPNGMMQLSNELAGGELTARALALYKPPFKFMYGYIHDGDGRVVADNNVGADNQVLRVRGWGRISYMENAEALQDEVGEVIAVALTEYWQKKGAQ